MKSLYILGSTGSIGTQTLDVVRNHPEAFKVLALSCGKNIDLLIRQIEEFGPHYVSVAEQKDAEALKAAYPTLAVGYGAGGLREAAICAPNAANPLVVNALVGINGLVPTIAALEAGRDVALANKETLVAGGTLVRKAMREHGARLLPIDSEHSGLWQLLRGEDPANIRKVYLTASGGALRHLGRDALQGVTKAEALKHPNWQMGPKVTIDSATMMNKGFEIIEAMHLFELSLDKIEPLIHPESLIHAIVEFTDGSSKAQLSLPDMRGPIAYALFYPKRAETIIAGVPIANLGKLTFSAMDYERYPLLKTAVKAARKGETATCVLNAANEAAVALFLEDQLSFLAIEAIVDEYVDKHQPIYDATLADIIALDKEIKRSVRARFDRRQGE